MTRRVLLLALGALLAACGGGGGTTGSVSTPSELRAISSTPADGAQNVALDATVSVTFSAEIDPVSVTATSLRVGVVGSGEVPGTAEQTGERTLVWTPTTGLFPLASHAVQISGGLRSVDGAYLTGGTQLGFRTTSGPPPVPLPEQDQLRATLGRLNVGRRSHTATLLADGRVLVAGGYRQETSVTDTAELYASDLFALTGSMRQARAQHTATRLADGRVLLAGGVFEASPGQPVGTAHAEVFDPSTGTFAAVGALNVDRFDHAAVLLPDGRVLVTGGSQGSLASWTDLDSAEIFDPATDTFTLLDEPMVHTHAAHVMADLGGGRVAIVGGSDTDLRPEIYEVATGEFTPISPAADDGVRFGAMGATFASGSLCVAGGDDRGSVLYLDNTTRTLLNSGSGLSAARIYGTATRIANDRILVVGGVDASRPGFFMLQSADLVAEGGIAGSLTFATELFFPTPMVFHTATRLLDGDVLFCGGLTENFGELEQDAAYLFTP